MSPSKQDTWRWPNKLCGRTVLFAVCAFSLLGRCLGDMKIGSPEIFQLEPRGIQRGLTNRIKLIGTNFVGLTELKVHNSKLTGELLQEPPPTTNIAWLQLLAPADLPRGAYELSVKNTNTESSKAKLY